MRDDDLQLRHDVEAELEWDTRLDARDIAVRVKNQIVTLTGRVLSYIQVNAALEAAQRVERVCAVANALTAQSVTDSRLSDTDIAEQAVMALKARMTAPAIGIRLTVRAGWITMGGRVDNWSQKRAAEDAVVAVTGCVGFTSSIVVPSMPPPDSISATIVNADAADEAALAGNCVV